MLISEAGIFPVNKYVSPPISAPLFNLLKVKFCRKESFEVVLIYRMGFPFSFLYLQPSVLQPLSTQMHTMAFFFSLITFYIKIGSLQKSYEDRESVPHTKFSLLLNLLYISMVYFS